MYRNGKRLTSVRRRDESVIGGLDSRLVEEEQVCVLVPGVGVDPGGLGVGQVALLDHLTRAELHEHAEGGGASGSAWGSRTEEMTEPAKKGTKKVDGESEGMKSQREEKASECVQT